MMLRATRRELLREVMPKRHRKHVRYQERPQRVEPARLAIVLSSVRSVPHAHRVSHLKVSAYQLWI